MSPLDWIRRELVTRGGDRMRERIMDAQRQVEIRLATGADHEAFARLSWESAHLKEIMNVGVEMDWTDPVRTTPGRRAVMTAALVLVALTAVGARAQDAIELRTKDGAGVAQNRLTLTNGATAQVRLFTTFNAQGNPLVGLPAPTAADHAATRGWVESNFMPAGMDAWVNATGDTMSGPLSIGTGAVPLSVTTNNWAAIWYNSIADRQFRIDNTTTRVNFHHGTGATVGAQAFLRADGTTVEFPGSVGIGTATPGSRLEVTTTAGTAVRGIGYDIGVVGVGTAPGAVGLAGQGTGSSWGMGVAAVADGANATYNRGVYATASNSTGSNCGIYGSASGAAGAKYGLYGSAVGDGGVKYGVYGTAAGVGENWAGYFFGNARVTGSLTVDGSLATGSAAVVANLNADMVDGYHAGSFALASHTHSFAAISGSLAAAQHGDLSASTSAMHHWNSITSKPSTFAPTTHAASHHAGGVDALSLGSIAGGLTASQHGDLSASTSAMHHWNSITGKPTSFAPTTHAASHHAGGVDALSLGSIAGGLTASQHGNLSGAAGTMHGWSQISGIPSMVNTINSLAGNPAIAGGGLVTVTTNGATNTITINGSGDNLGSHTATQALAMGTNNISGIGSLVPGLAISYCGTPGAPWVAAYSYNFINPSFERFKKDIRRVEAGELRLYGDLIRALPVIQYRLRHEVAGGADGDRDPGALVRSTPRLGTLADGLPPEILDETRTGIELASYCALLLAGIKDLQRQLDDLRAQMVPRPNR